MDVGVGDILGVELWEYKQFSDMDSVPFASN